MLALVVLITALLPSLNCLVAAAPADGVDFFYIQQRSLLDFTNVAVHQPGVGRDLPACEFDGIGTARSDDLGYGQHICGSSPIPEFVTFQASCDAGPKQANIYQRGGRQGDVYEAYCSGDDGSVIGNCYYRCEGIPCASVFSGGVAVKIMDCYFDTCARC